MMDVAVDVALCGGDGVWTTMANLAECAITLLLLLLLLLSVVGGWVRAGNDR
jgi:hypothetical protein